MGFTWWPLHSLCQFYIPFRSGLGLPCAQGGDWVGDYAQRMQSHAQWLALSNAAPGAAHKTHWVCQRLWSVVACTPVSFCACIVKVVLGSAG